MNERSDPSAAPGSWERHSRSVGFGIFVLALGVLAGAGARSAHSRENPAAWPQNKQEVLTLTATQRDAQVRDMQDMLRAMQAVMNAADAMDVPKIRSAAQAAGMAGVPGEDVLGQLPRDYRAKLMETHAAFDAMADAVRGFTARDSVLSHLSDISQRCVNCHAAYKFGPAK
jgi:cytochrome c556